MKPTLAILILPLVAPASPSPAATGSEVQARIDADLAAGRPIVVHVVVALCDNENQGIVPVPETLGDGQDPKSNLYWGALYGVATHFPRAGAWKRLPTERPDNDNILERVLFRGEFERGGEEVVLHVVADAWDGAQMRAAITAFLQMAAGHRREELVVAAEPEALRLAAGGQAQLVAFVGHDGLMDFTLSSPESEAGDAAPRSAIVLACVSKDYFGPLLREAGAHELLLTTGLMAPEAYSLDAALRAWIAGGTTDAVGEAAAAAYHRYQNCGLRGARRLFWGAP